MPYVLTVLFGLMASLWAYLSRNVEPPCQLAIATCAGASSVLLLVASRKRDGFSRRGLVHAGIALATIPAALLLASSTLARQDALSRELGSSSLSTWTFRVADDATLARRGLRWRAEACRAGSPRGFVWLTGEEELEAGDLVVVVGRFVPPKDDEWGRTSRAQGICGTVSVYRVASRELPRGPLAAVRAFRDRARRKIDPGSSDARALLAGCVIGDRRAIKQRGLDRLFARTGVSHVVAVSGAHIAIIGSLLGAALERMRMLPRLRAALVVTVSGLFVLACGCPASAVRAWVMSGLGWGGKLVGRRSDGLSALGLAGIAMVLMDPSIACQLGFQLSVTCVAGLALFGSYAGYALDVLLPRVGALRRLSPESRIRLRGLRSRVVDTVAATLVAQTVSAPLVVPVFGQLSLVAPLANLFLGAPLMLTLAMGLIGCSLALFPLVHLPFLASAESAAAFLVCALRLIAKAPLASVPVETEALWLGLGCGGALGLLYLAWPRLSRRALVVAAMGAAVPLGVMFVAWRYLAPARIVVLDVGQGDAVLVQDGASAVLVDTGPDQAVVSALARMHVLHLDAIVITHLHDDHTGGTDDVMSSVGCDTLVVAQGVGRRLSPDLELCVREFGCAVEEVAYRDRLRVGSFDLKVVSPVVPVTGNENADSIELLVTYQGAGDLLVALLTGDAERDETGAAIERGDVGDIDFLKVGHHGSAVSLDAAQAVVLDPELAVASAGAGNSYGHPRPECVSILEDAGACFLCTMDCGDVEVRPGATGPVVAVARAPAGQGGSLARLRSRALCRPPDPPGLLAAREAALGVSRWPGRGRQPVLCCGRVPWPIADTPVVPKARMLFRQSGNASVVDQRGDSCPAIRVAACFPPISSWELMSSSGRRPSPGSGGASTTGSPTSTWRRSMGRASTMRAAWSPRSTCCPLGRGFGSSSSTMRGGWQRTSPRSS